MTKLNFLQTTPAPQGKMVKDFGAQRAKQLCIFGPHQMDHHPSRKDQSLQAHFNITKRFNTVPLKSRTLRKRRRVESAVCTVPEEILERT